MESSKKIGGYKIPLLVVSSLLIASVIGNIYLYSNSYNVESESNLQQEIEVLRNEMIALNATFDAYMDTHTYNDNEYQSLEVEYSSLLENIDNGTDYETLQNQFLTLTTTHENYVSGHTFSNSEYNNLLENYEELISQYDLINSPASTFTSIEDLQIELTTDRTVYAYTDSILGNISIKYLNGSSFEGTFTLGIHSEFGAGGISIGTNYYVNGYGDFLVEPPYSFLYGPGIYSVRLYSIRNIDGYNIAPGNELSDAVRVQVEAK